MVAKAASLIADQQVRNRGTIGGSLAHGDPASDLPGVLLALDGSVTARGAGGEREIAAADLFQDYLTTALEPDEVITSVQLAGARRLRLRLREVHPPRRGLGDGRRVRARQGVRRDLRGRAHRAHAHGLDAAARHRGRGGAARRPLDAERIAAAAEQAADGTEPPGDLNATPDYKRHLARVLTRRALEAAAGRAA